LRSLEQRAAIPVHVSTRDVGRCSDTVEEAVYFCALEAIQNATKHAGAGTHVVVTLERHDDELDLTILDDGVGFDYSARAAGIGLVSMRDRLGAVGGDIGISSSPGAGTTIRAHVPDCRPAV